MKGGGEVEQKKKGPFPQKKIPSKSPALLGLGRLTTREATGIYHVYK